MSNAVSRALLEQQFERMLADHGSSLARLAGSYTNSASDREDLLQEIAMNLWQALPGFRGECSERTFVFRIAHNRAITFMGRYRALRASAEEPLEHPDPGPSPEAALAAEQQGSRLANAVRSLPMPYREVVVLSLEGLEYNDIAQVLGISESNVGVRLNRARQMLRRIMGDRR